MLQKKRCCVLNNQQLVPFKKAWSEQKSLVDARINDADLKDILILLEHPVVYTLGTGSNPDFLQFDPQLEKHEIYKIERGGEVTHHCPGQLVGYPILNLRYHKQDLHWYLRQLETVIINTVANYGLKAYRIPNLTGVWLEGKKIAAIGIKVRRWITMHGFAVNVCPDLSGFDRIIPCGISDRPVGSLAEFVPNITVNQVRFDIARAFAEVFQVELIEQRQKAN
ncbi:MAG: lipoyl(octanoyl) transferase LipB [Cyanobacteria bacterium P01_G01_bin.39]